jgi:hypothetical protein
VLRVARPTTSTSAAARGVASETSADRWEGKSMWTPLLVYTVILHSGRSSE